MGFSATILLALVVYLDFIQDNVPVWSATACMARIVWLFVISIIGIGYDARLTLIPDFFRQKWS